MSRTYDVVVLVGSLRTGAFTRQVASALIDMAPPTLRLTIVEIAPLPIYNPDDDQTPPPAWVEFRERVKIADAVLFVTPEYNRSIPGALKNALDVGSRPYGQNAWGGKPGAVISVSPGAMGGFGANHHLRQCLVFLNVPAMPQPEAYIGGVASSFNEDGALTNERTRTFFSTFLTAFEKWIAANIGHNEGPT